MMGCMKICKHLLAMVLAIAVGFSPLAPVFAASAMAKTSQAAHGDTGAASTLHADHGKVGEMAGVDDQPAAGCAQHDQCSGKCCAACAQCFTAAFHFSSVSVETYSVQFPTALHLDDRLTVAAHNRPPAA